MPGVIEAICGGLAIGFSVAVNAVLLGRVTGISGIVGGVLAKQSGLRWRLSFLGGLAGGGWILRKFLPSTVPIVSGLVSPLRLAAAGLLVGFGTRLGSGCTSGHGVCGLGRLSKRSLVNVLVFMTSGALTAILTKSVSAYGAGSLVTRDLFTPDKSLLKSFVSFATPAILSLMGIVGASFSLDANIPKKVHEFASPIIGASTGYLFAIGLGVAGMTNPIQVVRFLDFTRPYWNPSLAFVMGSALVVSLSAFSFLRKRNNRPLLCSQSYIPCAAEVDMNLIIGGALFGAGWGLGGFCPGPMLVSFFSRPEEQANQVVTGAMLVGALVYQQLQKSKETSFQGVPKEDTGKETSRLSESKNNSESNGYSVQKSDSPSHEEDG
ncbi:uncharacterized protein Gasu_37870 [Galdieria sulphuraria]|uniref:Sulphur transport domain-containing protein n=1 Tax=Galdieria sulphuraria TaxID=130081 RepID=M2VZH1_GALSU|nr:uncharacterized protein Gasu_37870 [Galdieria sulphuraria]EME28736.1 hypothetical protein Gasu_37870 [Galdieria sulphuraria]|eukprot:XP_005705256.1 hypothetical protein Gasu_37870 [Galdieria sulphuraria]